MSVSGCHSTSLFLTGTKYLILRERYVQLISRRREWLSAEEDPSFEFSSEIKVHLYEIVEPPPEICSKNFDGPVGNLIRELTLAQVGYQIRDESICRGDSIQASASCKSRQGNPHAINTDFAGVEDHVHSFVVASAGRT